MLLYLFITFFSFVFLSKSAILNSLPPWASDMRFPPLCFWKQVSISSIFNLIKITPHRSYSGTKKMGFSPKVETPINGGSDMLSVLDLPELTLDCILEMLSPSGLCSMAGVCSSLRERCVSDHLWERHMKQKWGRLIDSAAQREWQWHLASTDSANHRQGSMHRFLTKFLSIVLPWWRNSRVVENSDNRKETSSLSLDSNSIMSKYLALESGNFWFPAQVYNREDGHVGFMLSCYDAELSYDHRTDTFQARYPPHGRRAAAIEIGVPWERLRAPPVDTSPHHLHASEGLNHLRPGDHIEIQWRRNKEFPYGWWYGVVGHLELCDGNETYCGCHNSDTVVLEFNHYTPGSRWRQTTISRKDHREEGNEADGFYGGIRKLKTNAEISTWRRLWPAQILE